jgi:hypothetical protein
LVSNVFGRIRPLKVSLSILAGTAGAVKAELAVDQLPWIISRQTDMVQTLREPAVWTTWLRQPHDDPLLG